MSYFRPSRFRASGVPRSLFRPENRILNISDTTGLAAYTGAVDATSGWAVPASADDWTSLLLGTGIGNPTSLWLLQEAAGNLADSIASNTLTAAGLTYQRAVTGWTRKGVGSTSDGGAPTGLNNAGAIGDLATNSHLMLGIVKVFAAPAATRDIFGFGGSITYRGAQFTAAGAYKATPNDGSATATGAADAGATVRPVVLRVNRAAGTWGIITDQESVTPSPYTAPPAGGSAIFLGAAVTATPNYAVLYLTCWRGAAAEMTDVQVTELIRRIKSGGR